MQSYNLRLKKIHNSIINLFIYLFLQEFDETSNNCLEDVKLKDIKCGCYINSSYIKKCLSTKSGKSLNNFFLFLS